MERRRRDALMDFTFEKCVRISEFHTMKKRPDPFGHIKMGFCQFLVSVDAPFERQENHR